MKNIGAGRVAGRVLITALLAVSMTGGVSVAAAPIGSAPTVPADAAPAPAELVQETGSWFSHGRTLELRDDGTGEFAVWLGAFDGTRIQLSLIPAPGAAAVAEVAAVHEVGAGALAPAEQPGVGGLVTITFGDAVRTAHVEWTSGAHRLSADLCPTEGLDAQQMAALRCGA